MKIHKQKIITIVLVIILLAFFGFLWYQSSSKSTNTLSQDNPYFQELSPNDITKISIIKGNQETILELSGQPSSWVVTSQDRFPADSTSVSTFLIMLKEMKVRSIASENKDNVETFDLTPETATQVRLYKNENEAVNILIGKGATGGRSTYITSDTDTAVYVMDKAIGPQIKSDWRSKNITLLTSENIKQILWDYNTSRVKIEKQDNVWKGVEPESFNADQNAISALLSSVSNLLAVSIPDQNTVLGDVKLSITLTDNNGDVALHFFDSPEEGKVLAKNSQGFLYTLSISDYEAIALSKDALVTPAATQ